MQAKKSCNLNVKHANVKQVRTDTQWRHAGKEELYKMEIDPEHEKKRCKNVVIKNEMKIPTGQRKVIISGQHVLKKSIQKIPVV